MIEQTILVRGWSRVAMCNADAFSVESRMRDRREIIRTMEVRVARSTVCSIASGHRREQRGHVGDASPHGPRRILTVGYGNDVGARNETDSRLQTDDAVDGAGTDERAIRFCAHNSSRQTRRDRNAASRTRTAGIAVEHIRIFHQSANGGPAADGMRAAY